MRQNAGRCGAGFRSKRLLQQLLHGLPDEQRQLIELRAAGLTAAEIGVVLGKSETAVRQAQSRLIRSLLRAQFDVSADGGCAMPEQFAHGSADFGTGLWCLRKLQSRTSPDDRFILAIERLFPSPASDQAKARARARTS
ncbi:MAG: sigma factor-like helix-turn-helix DNA-binding protein [Thermomicrobiales bacterium]